MRKDKVQEVIDLLQANSASFAKNGKIEAGVNSQVGAALLCILDMIDDTLKEILDAIKEKS